MCIRLPESRGKVQGEEEEEKEGTDCLIFSQDP